ncbi:MAG: MFS transporter [Anaerolineaceae bacterium]|nr:MFS transporter [Anaerolineaceae bacterium]
MTAAAAERPFYYKKTIIVGFGFLGISIIWPIFNQYIPIFLQAGNPAFEGSADVRGFGLGPALALFIMTWDNLINVFVQPWVGAKSDQTWNRFGRRKPWILLGVPIALVGFILIPFAQTAVAIAAFILITNFGMALFRSPTVAWLGDLYEPENRSKANGIINLMGGVGGLLAFFGGGALFEYFSAIDPELGRMAPFIGGGILLLAAALVALLGVREPEKVRAEAEPDDPGVLANLQTVWRNPDKSGLLVLLGILLWFMAFNALEAGLSSFAVFTLDISPGTASIYAGSITISFILFAVPAGLIGTKYGRRQAIRIGLTGLTVLLFVGYFLIQGAVTFIAILVLAGIFWACVNVNSLPLVYDHGDERRIGAYTGLYYFSSQLAAVLGPTLGGVVVDTLGSDYRWLFLFSAVFMGLAWIVIQRMRPA